MILDDTRTTLLQYKESPCKTSQKNMAPIKSKNNNGKKLGVIIGGSGLIGGTLTYYFKTKTPNNIDILAPSSKRLSLREPDDIKQYFQRFKPDFIINAAIASIDSNPQLAFETNYLGSVYLAHAALELNIPYIHISSAAVLPTGENLNEEDRLELTPDLSNYSKSKLMSELTLEHLHKKEGLDYTNIRIAIVYGEHDHKIQGFHRLFFTIVNQAMPLMLTQRGVMHSYTNVHKIPYFIEHALGNRDEFSGHAFNFVDRNPVELAQLILTIKSFLELSIPKEMYVPLSLAKASTHIINSILHLLSRLGIEARLPPEIMFLENFYRSQTLSSKNLEESSFEDPWPEATIFTELPEIIQYYLTRWEYLNLISAYNKEFFDPQKKAEDFLYAPEKLLETIHNEEVHLLNKQYFLNNNG